MRRRERNRTKRRENGAVIERKPGSRTPFRRVLLIMAAVKATTSQLNVTIMGTPAHVDATTAHGEAIQMAQSYKSRGHGGKHRTKNKIGGSRRFQDRSKYDPGNEEHMRLTDTLYRRTARPAPIRFMPRAVQEQVSGA